MEASATATATAMSDHSNKENTPPVCTKGKKNPILPMATSSKKCSKRRPKRIPLADITGLFNNSAGFTVAQQENEVSASPLLQSNSRRRTPAAAPGSKTLRMGFR